MALPGQTITKSDGNIGSVTPAASKPLIVGPSSGGTQNTVYTFSQAGKVAESIGYGPAQVLAAMMLAENGGSVDVIVSAASVSATSGSLTTSSLGIATFGVSGTPRDTYIVSGTIVSAGTVAAGTGRFKYSLDGGETYSAPIPVTSSVSLTNTGLTLNFGAGTLTAGGTFSFETVAPQMNSTDLDAAMDAYKLLGRTPSLIAIANEPSSASSGATLVSAMDTHLDELEDKFVYTQVVMSAGGKPAGQSPATVKSAYASTAFTAGRGGMVVAERARRTIPTPFAGYANPSLPFAYHAACAAQARDISSAPSAVAFGGLVSTSDPTYDEFLDGETYHESQIVAPRSFQGLPGVFLNQSFNKSSPNSDYAYFERLRVANRIAQVVQTAQTKFINSNVKVLTDGTGRIDPEDAAVIEGYVNAQLRAALLNVTTQFGKRGHVSDILYTVNRENDVLATGILESSVVFVPLAKVTSITTTLSFTRAITVAGASE